MDQNHPPRKSHGQDQALASDTFDKFCNASTLKDILALYRQLCAGCKLVPTRFQEFFPKIRGKIPSWRAEELWSRFDKKAAEKCYARGRYCANTKVLIIGAGPCGLRAAIDAQLLGAKVVVIEKRDKLSRNNVLHLWPFVITDLRALGAKALYGKFCAGSIDHISIRQIQCILLKVALLLGVEFHEGVGFQGLREPSSSAVDDGWRAHINPPSHPVAQYQFDVVLGADGRQSVLSSEGFKRKALRAKLAIAITANFVNKHTEAEAKVEEISGVSYIFRQQFFQDMDDAMGIALENIVYYKDETHYFVMTPKKQSLLEKGVLYQDFPEPELLLSPENVDQEALHRFTMEAVVFATDNRLPELEFALNHYGQPDVAIFDFTTMYASENACRAVQRKGHKLLIGLVGDALLEPFWPTGSGCARGFLSSYDAAWMIRQWGKGLNSVLEVLAERESIYRLLGQTTPENLAKDHSQYNIDPRTRYPKINLGLVNARQITWLYDSDVPIGDIFDPIRDPSNKAHKEFVMPEEFLVRWLQEQLQNRRDYIGFANILDVFNGASALHSLLHKYRPDLIPEHPVPQHVDRWVRNQLLFEIFQEEFDLHLPMDCEKSVRCGEGERGVLTRYLSQIYLRFKGDIPRDNVYDSGQWYNNLGAHNNHKSQYPNNSKLHHSLSIKEFLRAKEQLEKAKKEEENNNQSRREKRRSQFYDALMQMEENQKNGCNGGVVTGGSIQRSQTTVNVVIPVVKLNPVPPGELFAACRQGREKEVATESRPASVASSNPNAQKSLTRSRSDVGFRRGPSPQLTMMRDNVGVPIGPGQLRKSSSGNSHHLQDLVEDEGSTAEALEMQMKIMKRRTTPAGNIISTFMQKQAMAAGLEQSQTPLQQVRRQNSGGGGGTVAEDNWTKRQIRDMRARSLNNSTFSGWIKKEDSDEQKNNELNNHFKLKQQKARKEGQQSHQAPMGQQGPDVSFKDKCKLLEKSIYNSGRDFKMHCSAAPWNNDGGRATTPSNNQNNVTINNVKNQGSVSPTTLCRMSPLQKSPTSAALIGRESIGIGVVPGAPGVSTVFMASKKQPQPEPRKVSFVNNKASENFNSIKTFQQNKNAMGKVQQPPSPSLTFQQQLQQQREMIEKKIGTTLQGIKGLANSTGYHVNGQIIHLGNGKFGRNGTQDNNNNSSGLRRMSSISPPSSPNQPGSHEGSPNMVHGLRRSQTSIGVHSPHFPVRRVPDSLPETDTDLDFLKQIDFETIDGQELQEFLSSF